MKIQFLKVAQIELDEAVQYYNYESSNLGEDFLKEVLNTLDRIGKFPKAWHPYTKRTR
ncbi:MAG: hypothetical protein R6V04_14010 [bacterium]